MRAGAGYCRGADGARSQSRLHRPRNPEGPSRPRLSYKEDGTKVDEPEVIGRIDEDLALQRMQERRVLACVAKLLDLGFFRIGGERYAEENESYGLATMRRSHLTVKGGRALFDFPAKSAKRQKQEIANRSVLPTLRAPKSHRGGGHELFAFRDGRGWKTSSPPRSTSTSRS